MRRIRTKKVFAMFGVFGIAIILTYNYLYWEATALTNAVIRNVQTGAIRFPNEMYYFVPNVVTPDTRTSQSQISICTQTSIGNLHYVIGLSKAWDGELSVAVFSYGEEILNAIKYIALLYRCSRDVKSKTRFHLVFPISQPSPDLKNQKWMDLECSQLPQLKLQYSRENYDNPSVPYPVNILRNVALMYARAPYVFNLDIDFLPSKGLEADMETFLRQRGDGIGRVAHVLPAFETDDWFDVMTKEKLVQGVTNGFVHQFTHNRYSSCQNNTNYPKWLALPHRPKLDISYYLKYKRFYEPYYIAEKKYLPMFDGRFKQYGYNRFSQVCEAHVSGFKFAVMNNAFVIHDGIKSQHFITPTKAKENKANGKLFFSYFIRELHLRYPNSTRQC